MIEIQPREIRDTAVRVPGSKSFTHRTLIAAALSDGLCRIENHLVSEDTNYTLSALEAFGTPVKRLSGALEIMGRGGRLESRNDSIYLGNSGTSMRLLTAVAALGTGPYVLTGTDRMGQRPIQHLLNALNQLGIHAASLRNNGCPPVEIMGKPFAGGPVFIDCTVSSQFLSGLLLIGPYAKKGLEIHVTRGLVSRPYVDMTIDIMKTFGVRVERDGYAAFTIPGGQVYRSGRFTVEPDASQAGYFWAAGAVTGHAVKVLGISKDSVQGDVKFVDVLESMGCQVRHDADGIAVAGGKLSGVDVDMRDMPDIVPTLAVVAAFADGITRIRNVSHLKVKESDRLSAVIHELTKMGISAKSMEDDLIIIGGTPHGAVIDTYDDHRMAMSFAVAGLRTPGVRIQNERCVEKSFPDFWEVLAGLNKNEEREHERR